MNKKNVLILGSGAREHALAVKFQESPRVGNVYVMPGNDGIRMEFSTLHYESFDDISRIIKEKAIHILFIGNEQYLADGVVDFLTTNDSLNKGETNCIVIGPTQRASMIESSKVFAKELMQEYGIPTASSKSFHDIIAARIYLKKKKFPVVIKADGLAAGKGVLIATNEHESNIFIEEVLSGQKFGLAGSKIIIEDYLLGEEASIFAFCDGINFVSTIFVQDHKKALEGEKGPNTGGMGSIAPLTKFSHLQKKVDQEIFAPILEAMQNKGCPFKGILFAGLMIKDEQIHVIEFNCRFGDPETQVILPLLENDLLDICEAIAQQRIKDIKLRWKNKYAINVVLASIGYPDIFQKGKEIKINNKLFKDEKIKVYFAGITEKKGVFTNSGGRVLGITVVDDTLKQAIDYVYSNISAISSENLRYRHDIGTQ